MIRTMGMKGLIIKFASIITLECFYFLVKLSVYVGIELREDEVDLRLGF